MIGGAWDLCEWEGVQAERLGEGEFVRVFADELDVRGESCEDLSAEQAEASVAEDGDAISFRDVDLARDFDGGGEGLGEDGLVVGNGIGYSQEIGDREREALGEAAVAFVDAEHGAVAAMLGPTTGAQVAFSAGAVDGSDDAFADPVRGGGIGNGFDYGDKLVAEHAFVRHVAFAEFDVGGADADEKRAEDGFAGERGGDGLIEESELALSEADGFHARDFPWAERGF